jgi:hypothetical protein
MPPAHGFWVILAGDTPTSFRARTREVLLPTLHQLRRTQPTVSLRWFERNRVWTDPAEAQEALRAMRNRRRAHPVGWRPGGAHEDPRARFKLTRDEKRARFKTRQRRPPKSGNSPK